MTCEFLIFGENIYIKRIQLRGEIVSSEFKDDILILSVIIPLNCKVYSNFTEADNMVDLLIKLSLRFSQHNMLHKRCLTVQSG